MTAAAIDRLVHHAVIIEIDRGSVRAEEAKKRNAKKEKDQGASSQEAGEATTTPHRGERQLPRPRCTRRPTTTMRTGAAEEVR